MPRLGRHRGSPEFSDVCLLFVLGSLPLLWSLLSICCPDLWVLCPWHHFHPRISFSMAAVWVQASLSSACMVSTALSLLLLLVWPLQTIPTLVQVGHPPSNFSWPNYMERNRSFLYFCSTYCIKASPGTSLWSHGYKSACQCRGHRFDT